MLMHFFTILDDSDCTLFKPDIIKELNVSVFPVSCFVDSEPRIERINIDAEKYIQEKENGREVSPPFFSEKLIEYIFEKVRNQEHIGTVLVLPHCEYLPYKESAEKAMSRCLNRYRRDRNSFDITVIDSKSFAAGTMINTMRLAELYKYSGKSIKELEAYSQDAFSENTTFVLTRSECDFCTEGGFHIHKITGDKKETIRISDMDEHIVFNKFSEMVSENVLKTGREYALSIGYDCSYAANILGRLETECRKNPCAVIKYGVSSVFTFGKDAICVNIV